MRRKPRHPEIPIFDFDLYELNERAMGIVGHDRPKPDVLIIDKPFLASVQTDLKVPSIELHPLFNVVWLPKEVMEHVLIHEHIHLLIPPREVKPGKMKSHPPEFWEVEHGISPLSGAVWTWMYMEWPGLLTRDEKAEGIRVNRGWKKAKRDSNSFWKKVLEEAGLPPRPQDFTTWEQAVERFQASIIKEPFL